MTTAVKEKKPFLPQRKPQLQPGGGAVGVRGGNVARPAVGTSALIIGGQPRVHLLPREVVARKKAKLLRRRMLFGSAIVVVIVVGAYGLVTVNLTSAQSQLQAAQATTTQILAQKAKYGAVTKVNADIASIQSAQKTTTVQEIQWAPLVAELQATLPAGGSITAVIASIDSPFGSATPGTPSSTPGSAPFEKAHISTVQLTVSMPQGAIPGWLNLLASIKGVADVTPNSVNQSTDSVGKYTVLVTVHLDTKAVSGRFAKDGTK
jgi:hypothetical protein